MRGNEHSPVNVLLRADCLRYRALAVGIDVRAKWELHQDAIDGGVPVELLDDLAPRADHNANAGLGDERVDDPALQSDISKMSGTRGRGRTAALSSA